MTRWAIARRLHPRQRGQPHCAHRVRLRHHHRHVGQLWHDLRRAGAAEGGDDDNAETFPLDGASNITARARTYAYSGDGLLQSRATGGATVDLLRDPATSPSRLLSSGCDKIVYGLGPLYSVNGSTVTTYARDGQKSIRAELNGSSVTSSWRYRAYGDVVQSSGAATASILGYAGQLLEIAGKHPNSPSVGLSYRLRPSPLGLAGRVVGPLQLFLMDLDFRDQVNNAGPFLVSD